MPTVAALEYVRNVISPVYGDLYGAFEDEARERLRGRDEGIGQYWPQRSDWLAPSGARTRTSSEQASRSGTTNRVEIFLKMPHWSRAAGARVRADDLALAVSGQGLCTFQVGRGKGRGYIGEHWPTSGD